MLSNKELSFLELAIKTAEMSECRQRHGAVITKGGSVLSIGWNKLKNHPSVLPEKEILFHAGVHAEVDCIKKLGSSARGATIYIARINKGGEVRYSEPCKNCKRAIEQAGIKKVIYTIDNM